MNVDWRNRYGRNWISSVRHQGGSDNCWAFATTALLEAMIRIEHTYWVRRSEGDIARGAGKEAWDLGNVGEALGFVQTYGAADPECFPWGESVALYVAKPHQGGISALPMSATPDRPGRSMRLSGGPPVTVTTAADKKNWINTVGPMALQVVIPHSFTAYHTGIYRPLAGESARGPHLMLVVGFNDDDRCWILKNSYGPQWGEQGFIRISYDGVNARGELVAGGGMLEVVSFTGIRGTSPDPWSRRRLRNGNLVQSASGALRNNFELFLRDGRQLTHWYLENSVTGQPWRKVSDLQPRDPYDKPFGSDADDFPAAVQSSFNRNYELIYPAGNGLRHVYFNQASGWWNDGGSLAVGAGVIALGGARGGIPHGGRGGVEAGALDTSRPVGIPSFIQGNRGAPGDFEVIVVKSNKLAEHWTKHNSSPWTRPSGEWYLKETFGSSFAFGGPGLVQSKLGVTGSPDLGAGELHYVGASTSGTMQHWRRTRTDAGTWTLLGEFGQGITSAPCLIEGTYGCVDETTPGNFELCVVAGGSIEHWWRGNNPVGAWTKSATFGGGTVRRVIGLVQSSMGTNLELVAELTNGVCRHFYRDGAGWHAGFIVAAP